MAVCSWFSGMEASEVASCLRPVWHSTVGGVSSNDEKPLGTDSASVGLCMRKCLLQSTSVSTCPNSLLSFSSPLLSSPLPHNER